MRVPTTWSGAAMVFWVLAAAFASIMTVCTLPTDHGAEPPPIDAGLVWIDLAAPTDAGPAP